jgi:hypothetical protein
MTMAVASIDNCTEHNFRAASLQGGEACRLLSVIISSNDIFAGNVEDVRASCRVVANVDGGGGANRTAILDCVRDVMDVAEGMARDGCSITGG